MTTPNSVSNGQGPAIRRYPFVSTGRPHVIVVGGGVAGMTTAQRLLERGHDVTMLEANSYLGGKLGAHQEADERVEHISERFGSRRSLTEKSALEMARPFGSGTCAHCDVPGCCAARETDWHEHCYHMYLNWYHNFWKLVEEIGIADRFEPITRISYFTGPPGAPALHADNPGSPGTAWQNMTSGVAPAPDVFLHSESILDLLAKPAHADHRLDQISVEAFLRELGYTTARSRQASHQVLAKAFAAPTAIASASSYRSFLKYGARMPAPAMWLLTGNTEEALFSPWLKALSRLSGRFRILDHREPPREIFRRIQEENDAEKAAVPPSDRPDFTLMPLTALTGLEIDQDTSDFLLRIATLDGSPSAQPDPGRITADKTEIWRFGGQVVLTVPPRQLARIVYARAKDGPADRGATLAGIDNRLAQSPRLSGAPIMVLDVFLRHPPKTPLPKGIVILLGSRYEMSLYDNTQLWRDGHEDDSELTQISICASDADGLMPYIEQEDGGQVIVSLLLDELSRYVDFDREADLLPCRTHLQTNAGGELFVNAVNTWHFRPTTTTEVPDLFVAGDFVQTPVDVVTIEGAAMSGLMAAEAVRRRTGKGDPVEITVPDALPGPMVATAANTLRPLAYAAQAVSETDSTLRRTFKRYFPGE